MNKGTSATQESSVVIGGNAITLDQNIPNPLTKIQRSVITFRQMQTMRN